MQGGQQATILQDEIATMRQSHSISMKRLQVLVNGTYINPVTRACSGCIVASGAASIPYLVQGQISKQDSQIKSLQAERDGLAAQLEDTRVNLNTVATLAERHMPLQEQCLCWWHQWLRLSISSGH